MGGDPLASDSTFAMLPAVNGVPGAVSFESNHHPGMLLTAMPNATIALCSVNTTACKRLFSLGCVVHTDGAVLQRTGCARTTHDDASWVITAGLADPERQNSIRTLSKQPALVGAYITVSPSAEPGAPNLCPGNIHVR